MRIGKHKIDVGWTWAKYINIWGQLGAVTGTASLIMTAGIFYATTIKPHFNIPLWLYILVIFIIAVIGVTFVLKIGISGYYRFFSQTSELAQTNKRVKMIMKHLGINEEEDNAH